MQFLKNAKNDKGIFLILLFAFNYCQSQSNFSLDRDFIYPYSDAILANSGKFFSDIIPYDATKLNALLKKDTNNYKDVAFKKSIKIVSSGSSGLTMYPLFGAEGGFDLYDSKSSFELEGGAHADYTFKDKLTFSFNIEQLQMTGPDWLDSLIKTSRVIPGTGIAYPNANGSYSTTYWDGYLSWSPNSIFNFQAGKGKNFLGEGYRSLFLSDVSNSYPYFKITVTVWHIAFVNIVSQMTNMEQSGEQTEFFSAYTSFHYLSWNISKRLNIGLFEAVTYYGDSGSYQRGLDVEYLNPIQLYQPVNFNTGDPDKSNLGAALNVKAGHKSKFYGQLIIDEFKLHDVLGHTGWWGNKQGGQVGFKSYDVFKIKNLSLQTEINYVRPYTYAAKDPLQNYSNYGQPLADPMGANFIESDSFLKYRFRNILFEGSLVLYQYGADIGNANYGQNIFLPYIPHPNDYGNYTGQGLATTLAIAGLKASYIISPKMDLKAEVGAKEWLEVQSGTKSSYPYIYAGIRTSLGNLYNDF
jgi:hypothetical protein